MRWIFLDVFHPTKIIVPVELAKVLRRNLYIYIHRYPEPRVATSSPTGIDAPRRPLRSIRHHGLSMARSITARRCLSEAFPGARSTVQKLY